MSFPQWCITITRKKTIVIFQIVLISLVFLSSFPAKIRSDEAKQAACQPFTVAKGYFFDNYQRTEYVKGFLAIHLKLKTPYNDGRIWNSGFYMYKNNCTSEFFEVPRVGFGVRPRMQFYSIRFASATHFDFWDDEEDVKLACSSCSLDLPAKLSDKSAYTQVAYYGVIDGTADHLFSDSLPIQGLTKPRTPVLIIPGILGSELKNLDVTIWPNIDKILFDPSSKIFDQLDMGGDGRSIQPFVNASRVLSSIKYPFGDYHYSDTLVSELVADGYVQDETLFTFPYDWRMGVVDLAAKLQQKIGDVLRLSGASRVDIVAHSYGGLVLKQYLANVAFDSAGERALRKIIFVAVPHLGSPEAAKTLLFGSNFSVPLISSDEVQKISQNMPSVYYMLPSRAYFAKNPGYYDDLSDSRVKNILTYDQTQNMLLQLNKNKKLMDLAAMFHSDAVDQMDFSAKSYAAYNIAGCAMMTMQTMTKMYSGSDNMIRRIFHGAKYRLYEVSGDGTVPLSSAAHLKVPHQNMFFAKHIEHGTMLGANGVRQAIAAIIEDRNSIEQPNVTHDQNGCEPQGTVISLKSNLEFTIVDTSTGKIVPRNTIIPEHKTGDDVHILVPDTGKYKIFAKQKDPSQPHARIDVVVSRPTPAVEYITNYFNIDLQSNRQLEIKTGDIQPVVGIYDPSLPEAPVIPVAATDQIDQNSGQEPVRIQTSLVKANTLEAPVNGVMQLSKDSAGVIFQFSDPAAVADFQYSLDNGATWAVASPQQNMLTVPLDSAQISFFGESKAGVEEGTQTVHFVWQNLATDNSSAPQSSSIGPGIAAETDSQQTDPELLTEPAPTDVDSGTIAEITPIQEPTDEQQPNIGQSDTAKSGRIDQKIIIVTDSGTVKSAPPEALSLGPVNVTIQVPASLVTVPVTLPAAQQQSQPAERVIIIEKPNTYWEVVKKIYHCIRHLSI